MKVEIKKSQCSACMACYNICPKNCITMQYDEYGVLYPIIDEDKCINCGSCSKVCQIHNKAEYNEPIHTYASWTNDYKDRITSSSGAIASVLYNKIIQRKGIAVGVSYNKDLKLIYSYADEKKDLLKYKGSKYSQSYVGEIYNQVRDFLIKDKEVLFVGSPCQVNGLKLFLQRDYEKLITVDIICHGMPSQKYLDEYIKNIEEAIGKKADNLTFRGKENFKFTLLRNEEIIYSKSSEEDKYFFGFLNGIFYRDSCYECKYAKKERVGDITIGDFWGIGEDIPFQNKDKDGGISLVLVNTKKGEKIFNECKNELFLEKRPIEEAIKGNEQLREPSKRNHKNKQFKEEYKKYGFIEAIKDITK